MLFPRIFISKANANNGRNLPIYHFPVITFSNNEPTGCSNEEGIGAIIEAAIGAIVTPRNQPSCFFIFYFIISVAP